MVSELDSAEVAVPLKLSGWKVVTLLERCGEKYWHIVRAVRDGDGKKVQAAIQLTAAQVGDEATMKLMLKFLLSCVKEKIAAIESESK